MLSEVQMQFAVNVGHRPVTTDLSSSCLDSMFGVEQYEVASTFNGHLWSNHNKAVCLGLGFS